MTDTHHLMRWNHVIHTTKNVIVKHINHQAYNHRLNTSNRPQTEHNRLTSHLCVATWCNIWRLFCCLSHFRENEELRDVVLWGLPKGLGKLELQFKKLTLLILNGCACCSEAESWYKWHFTTALGAYNVNMADHDIAAFKKFWRIWGERS